MNESERELLSSYIDGRLTADKAAALERRLATDTALRLELDTLRETQLLLRGLPTLRAPRRLTLTPAMARPRSRPLYLSAWVSLASAAAALLLVVAGLLTLNMSAAPRAPLMVQQSEQAIAVNPTSSATPTTLPTLTREDDGQPQDTANAAPLLTATLAAEARTAVTTASPDAALMAAPAAADSAAGAAASDSVEPLVASTIGTSDVSGETESAAEMQFAATMPAQPTPAAVMTAQPSPAPTMTARPSATATTTLSSTPEPTAQVAQVPTLVSDALQQETARQADQTAITPSLVLIIAGVALLLFAVVTTLLRLRRR